MAPNRLLGRNPAQKAAYIMIGMALVVIGLALWGVSLDRRLDQADALRASEAKARTARAASECRARIAGTKQANDLLAALRDLASIPQTNLQTYLDGPLTADQRANYEDALERYRRAEKRFHAFPIPTCVRSDP